MDKNLLDNMSGQELKEMINDEIITLEDLDNTALEKILDFETDMLCFGAGDMTTIRRCSELLNKRNDSDVLNKDKIISIIDRVKREHVIIVDEEKTQESKAKVIRGKHIILRRIGLVAAIITVLMSVTVLVAAAFGVNIFEYISKIVRQDEGSQINVEQFTFHNGGEIKYYSSIEDMVEEQKWCIMHPTKLPENVTIEKITMYATTRGNDEICIITNNNNIKISIEKNAENKDIWENHDSFYESNGTKYYVFQEDGVYLAICYHNGDYYSIQSNNYDELILIIDNLKE
ncbi:MAG: hypothetical protein IKY21_01245 [Clostridia bacterium]|nr:hypothetical protein [Clostridia bacterium]